jgi:hypothetical protein
MQIHDELVFEVPADGSLAFAGILCRELAVPPTRRFRVPIVLEPKRGERFGSMFEVRGTRSVVSLRPPRRPISGRRGRSGWFQTPWGV